MQLSTLMCDDISQHTACCSPQHKQWLLNIPRMRLTLTGYGKASTALRSAVIVQSVSQPAGVFLPGNGRAST